MEIRRCDKCNVSLNIDEVKDIDYVSFEAEVKAIKMTVPTLKEVKVITPPAEGLDDNDTFGGVYLGRKIDLCSNCYPIMARIMTDWLNDIVLGVP